MQRFLKPQYIIPALVIVSLYSGRMLAQSMHARRMSGIEATSTYRHYGPAPRRNGFEEDAEPDPRMHDIVSIF